MYIWMIIKYIPCDISVICVLLLYPETLYFALRSASHTRIPRPLQSLCPSLFSQFLRLCAWEESKTNETFFTAWRWIRAKKSWSTTWLFSDTLRWTANWLECKFRDIFSVIKTWWKAVGKKKICFVRLIFV